MGIEYVHGEDEAIGLMRATPEQVKANEALKKRLAARQAMLATRLAAKAARARRKKAIEKASRKRNRR
jgi:hypothetical protein